MACCNNKAFYIKTYYAGKDQVTHPSLVSFDTPWHGYLHYMAYTPYPFANGGEENPSIAASNDLVNWEKPKELINPIAHCTETETDELKDAHLLYRADLDRLECWYLGRVGSTLKDGGPLHLLRKTSSDGVHWSEYEIMYVFAERALVSHSVIFNGTGYDFWGIYASDGLYYMNFTDGKQSDMQKCRLYFENGNLWHGSVTLIEGNYHFVWMGNSDDGKHIFHAVGKSPTEFAEESVVLVNEGEWQRLYRPFLHYYDGMYYLFYGVQDFENRWFITASKGSSPKTLDINTEYNGAVATQKAKSKSSIAKKLFGAINLKLFLILPVVVLIQYLFPAYLPLIWAGSCALCAVSIAAFWRYSIIKSLFKGIITSTAMLCLSSFIVDMLKIVIEFLSR